MEYAVLYITLACIFGLIMAWGIGANDVANAMATSVGSKAISIKQAIIIAAVFEFTGAVLAGGEVTSTIRKGIVDPSLLSATPELLVFGMLAALLSAGTWLFIASYNGWPVSTTHSIVGAVVGFAAVGIGVHSVQWHKITSIALSWVTSPLMAGIVAFLLFISVQRFILNHDDPLKQAKRYVPVYIFLAGFGIALLTAFKGLKHLKLDLSLPMVMLLAAGVGLFTAFLGIMLIRRIKLDPNADRDFHFTNVEKIFGVLMMITACAMAFAHGSNDVANAVGPMAAVVSIAKSAVVDSKSALPIWILVLGAVGIVIGLTTFGHRVIAVVGNDITDLTPSRGFAATLAAAFTVVFASKLGMPISTTHTLVGAVLGVGMARGIAALNMGVVRMIFMSWVITLPVGAFLAVIYFYLLKALVPV